MAAQPPVDPARGPIARLTVPPAARSVQGHRAGIVTRVLAGVVDGLVTVVAVAAGYGGVVAVTYLLRPRGFSFPDPGFGLLLVAFLALLTCYLGIAWATTGRTYGDRVLGLRVVDAHGRRIRPLVALVRALLCVLVPLLLFWVVFSRENRSAVDVLLRTSVVYDWAAASEPAGPAPRG
ncbi:RDD family protein [Intrasporangium flavum]|uniref:RDD family protein n=1 Tax=Intrasporangium flavum TaxID=1428657 RepID=UPI0009FA706A|nr:RDD family protein [Intrasporangium flavum]